MISFFRTNHAEQIEICERCGSVWDRSRRVDEAREAARLTALMSGWRLS